MHKIKCKHLGCDKEIEGYNKRHAEFLMMQHELKHRREKLKEDEKDKKI